jgi:hypothetical protein
MGYFPGIMLCKRPDRRIFCEKEPSVSRSMDQHVHLRDYMIIAAYGLLFFPTVANAIVLQAAYPRMDLLTSHLLCLVFIAKYFMLIK